MNLKEVLIFFIGLLLLINLILADELTGELFSFGEIEEIPSKEPIELHPGKNTLTPIESGPVLHPVAEGTSIVTPSGSTISNIAGSYNLLILNGMLIGGVIVSSADNNAIPAFNPLTGDVIIYNMDLGDTVTIDYTGEPAYRVQMSEGVEAEIQTNNKIRFTAHGEDSLLKIKPTEEPSYEFNNGLLEYENRNVLEQINTTKINDANVDKNYETGFKCLTLAFNANYNYKDKVKPERSFFIKNLNKQDYKVCIKKTIYDEYEMLGSRYCLIDLIKNFVKLKAKVIYAKQNKPVYESFDMRNDAEIETSLGITKLLITNKAPSSEVISKTYIGSHVITEKLQVKNVVRLHEFSEQKHPDLINIYSTSFRNDQPDIIIEDDMLVQEDKNRFTAMTQHNLACIEQLQSLFNYEEEESFYDSC